MIRGVLRVLLLPAGLLLATGTGALSKATEPCTLGCTQGGVAKVDYDGNGFVSAREDFKGNRTTYTRDLMGLERSRTEAFGTPSRGP